MVNRLIIQGEQLNKEVVAQGAQLRDLQTSLETVRDKAVQKNDDEMIKIKEKHENQMDEIEEMIFETEKSYAELKESLRCAKLKLQMVEEEKRGSITSDSQLSRNLAKITLLQNKLRRTNEISNLMTSKMSAHELTTTDDLTKTIKSNTIKKTATQSSKAEVFIITIT